MFKTQIFYSDFFLARGQYFGAAIDLINAWLSEHAPKIKAEIEPHWDAIYLAQKKYTTINGIL